MFQDSPGEREKNCKLKQTNNKKKVRKIQTHSSPNLLLCVIKLKDNNGEETTLKYSQNCVSKLLQATGVQITNGIIFEGLSLKESRGPQYKNRHQNTPENKKCKK